jgi:hypothetical protein
VESVLGHPIVLVLAVAGAIVALSWTFIDDPGSLARMRDPSDPTWRAQALLGGHPGVLIQKTGPSGFISGGYRVINPLLGGLLHRVSGVGTARFTALLQVGLPLLASLALAGFAFRNRRVPLAFHLALFVAASLFLSRLFLGYLDNQLSLAFLALAVAFLEPARTSWGARTAVGMMVFLSILTHPPTAEVFLAVVAAGAGIGLLARRFSIRRTLSDLAPALAAVGAGAVLGLLAFYAGAWGPRSSLGASFMFQPYSESFFRARLDQWLAAFRFQFTWPFFLAGILWLGWRVLRRQADAQVRMTLLWAVPLIGVLGFVIGLRYTYYRFLNATLAPMLVAAAGAWAIAAGALWLGRRTLRWGLRALPLVLLLAAAACWVAVPVFRSFHAGIRYVDKQSEWTQSSTRAAMAAASAYAATQPDRPIVFLMRAVPNSVRAWGLANQWTRIILAGVHGDQVARTYFSLGPVEDFLAQRPATTDQDSLDELSRGFLDERSEAFAAYAAEPIAFLVRAFNSGARPPVGSVVPLTPGVSVLEGPGLAPFDPGALPGAEQAAEAILREDSGNPAVFADLSHVLRIAIGLLVLLVLPGMLAAGWFGVRGFAEHLSFVPLLSLGMVLTAGFLVEAVGRTPLGPMQAWLALGLATVTGAALRFGPLVRRGRGPSFPSRFPRMRWRKRPP